MPKSTAGALNPKQRLFVAEYLVDRNVHAAARRAGYAESMANSGHLMGHPAIKAEIETRVAALQDKLDVSAEALVREAARIAFGDFRKFFYAEDGKTVDDSGITVRSWKAGDLKPVHELDDEAAALLSSYELGQHGPKLKTWDKGAALRLLFQHRGMLTDPAIAKLGQTLEDLLAGSYGTKEPTA